MSWRLGCQRSDGQRVSDANMMKILSCHNFAIITTLSHRVLKARKCVMCTGSDPILYAIIIFLLSQGLSGRTVCFSRARSLSRLIRVRSVGQIIIIYKVGQISLLDHRPKMEESRVLSLHRGHYCHPVVVLKHLNTL